MTATVKCTRCGVTVPIDKVDVPNRCMDERCPLKRKESALL